MLRDNRKVRWLGRELTVFMNEYGKRRVSWDVVKGGQQAGKWVTSNIAYNTKVGLGPSKKNAQASLGNKEPILGPGLLSPPIFEAGESSFSRPRALESSYQNGSTMPSSSRSELSAMKEFVSSMIKPTTSKQPMTSLKVSVVTPTTSEQPATSSKVPFDLAVTEVESKGGQHGPIRLA